jgi:hypothetical protein
MLTPIKQSFYNNAPTKYLDSIAEQGTRMIANNGTITDIECTSEETFNHAHNETFVNAPVSTTTARMSTKYVR